MKTITAIVPSFRRHENIPVIIDRIKKQTHPPNRIIIWNDNWGDFGADIEIDGVETINTNSNWWSNYGSYLIGYLTDTDYVAIIDDDMPPGLKWFEFCVKMQEKIPGLYGKYGVVFREDTYTNNRHFDSKEANGEMLEVDMIGDSYFVPHEAINCMLYLNPPTFHHTCDLHLCFTSQKFKGFKCYVPFPKTTSERPHDYRVELPYNYTERAMCDDWNHYMNRNGYVKWALRKGWKFLRNRDSENYEKSLRGI